MQDQEQDLDQNQFDRTIFRQTEAQFLLRGISGITFGKNFPLLGSMIVGRDQTCDITIPSEEVSRKHARVVARPGSILVEDMGSANGTFVNNKPVESAVLREGDEVRFDKVRFQLQSINQVDDFMLTRGNSAPEPPQQEDNKGSSAVKYLFIGALFIGGIAAAVYFTYLK